MPLYHFYRLVNNVDDRCYIGVTRRELRKRLYEHRHCINKKYVCSSKQLIDQYGKDNIDIILIHSLEYETIREAHREERRLVEEHRGRCVNLVSPYQLEEERKEQVKVYRESHIEEAKAWYEAHREEQKAKKKAWYEVHREEAKTRQKAYRDANKEALLTQKKSWYEANKTAYNARRKEVRAKAKALISVPTVVEHVA